MDDRTLRVLEYDKVLALLADSAACSLGRDRIARLQPETRPEPIQARLDETTEAAAAIKRFGSFPLGGLTDITEPLRKAQIGASLGGSELLAVAGCIQCARRMADYFAAASELAPGLAAVAERLSDHSEVRAEIERCLDDDGQVRRHASERLSRLYGRQSALESRARERMEAILRGAMGRDILQDPVLVLRDGRFCLPVKSEKRSQMNGVIHDRSDSGATVFIEPLELVSIGNELREVELEIEAEIKAILQALSGEVAAVSGDLQRDLQNLATLDFISARGRLSLTMQGAPPRLRTDGVTVLKQARHPLLRGQVVPVDFWIGDDFQTLIITGPNTGGKTVTLKTVGLLTLMAQSGLHLPTDPGSEVTVFDQVWADIGDEQSLEQSLSTFSSHMTQIIKILHRADAWRRRREAGEVGEMNALVLLDELGAGTDPTEGAALGQAVLEELHAAGCRTVVTTHYNDLKVFAYATEGMENGSVEFDVKNLEPTYRLLIGQPGSSNALSIAQRLGLPRRVTQKAREFLGDEHLRVEDALREMRSSQRELDRERQKTSKTQKDLEKLRAQYARDLAQLETDKAEAMEDGYDRALAVVRQAEEEARRIIAELQRQPRQSRVTEDQRQQVAALRRKIEAEARSHEAPAPPALQAEAELAAEPEEAPLQPGQPVHVRSLNRDGKVLARLKPGLYQVELGNLRVEAAAGDLQILDVLISPEARQLAAKMQMRKASTFESELNVRGTTVDEAILELEKYLDDAMLAGASEVRILHGKGTGALRQAIQKFLKSHPAIKSFGVAPRIEGGEGVTVAQLR
jgi:DNA mismatch repair protein MutS2